VKENNPAPGLPDADHLTYFLLQMAVRDLINRGLSDEEATDAFNSTLADVRAEAKAKRRGGLRVVGPKKGGAR
jgi:hypothetical protein